MLPLKYNYLFLFIIATFIIILGVHSAPEHGMFEEDSRVVWVPVMERRPEMTAAIGDALKSETEKTQRISKMLNKSITTQEEEAAQGSKKLHVLQTTHTKQTTNSAKALKTFVILPFCLLNIGQIFIKALI